jgi:hypothetical protein
MKKTPILLAVSAALLLAGCPFSAEFPLAGPDGAVADPALPGAWQTSDDSEEQFTLRIRDLGGGELYIVAESPEEEPESFPAIASIIGGQRFLSLQDTAEGGQWFFANYRIRGDRLLLRLVDDELFESRSFASPADLRDFVLQNLDDPRLYGSQNEEEWDWVLERAEPGA